MHIATTRFPFSEDPLVSFLSTMHLTFSPPLGETAHIVASESCPQLSLLFSVQVHGLAELERSGARVEVWSDIDAEDRWVALPFVKASNDDEDDTLYAHIQLGNAAKSYFSFTYRMVYPSGKVRWLGAFGQDGHLIVDTSPAALLPPGIESPASWSLNEEEKCWEISTPTPTPIISNLSHFHVWAFGADGIATGNASTVVLVPRFVPGQLSYPPSYVLSSSSGAHLDVAHDDDEIRASASESAGGTVRLVAYGVDSFPEQLLPLEWSVLAEEIQTKGVLCLVYSTTPTLPVQLVLLPVGHVIPGTITLALDSVKALAKGLQQAFEGETPMPIRALFNLPKKEVLLIGDDDDVATLSMGQSGVALSICPVYSITGTTGRVGIVVLCSPSVASTLPILPDLGHKPGHPHEHGLLPTPPPSPGPPKTKPMPKPVLEVTAPAPPRLPKQLVLARKIVRWIPFFGFVWALVRLFLNPFAFLFHVVLRRGLPSGVGFSLGGGGGAEAGSGAGAGPRQPVSGVESDPDSEEPTTTETDFNGPSEHESKVLGETETPLTSLYLRLGHARLDEDDADGYNSISEDQDGRRVPLVAVIPLGDEDVDDLPKIGIEYLDHSGSTPLKTVMSECWVRSGCSRSRRGQRRRLVDVGSLVEHDLSEWKERAVVRISVVARSSDAVHG